ncbi:MAG: hypothetical protein AMK71_01940 [Nitrospira bacterium SG8_35_4]|nr:MAG: hypothetical protein AMK71_01940 [Nitrospira bacterium SG8_35_4]
MQFFLFLAFVIAVMLVVITFQNPEEISIKFINWTFSEPLALALAIPFAAGLLTGLFLLIPVWWRKSKLARSQKKRIKELETELEQSATMPPESSEGVETEQTGIAPEKEEGFD